MKKKTTIGVSFPNEKILNDAKKRCDELGIRSFSEYVNQLIRLDLGLPNYIGSYVGRNQDAEKLADAVLEARATSVKGKGKQDSVA